MNITLVFPNVNRNKSYTSHLRKFYTWVNRCEQPLVVDQDSDSVHSLACNEGDWIYIEKTFAFNQKDSKFYYKVGQETATLENSKGEKRTVFVDVLNDGVLYVLDDNDFRKIKHVAA